MVFNEVDLKKEIESFKGFKGSSALAEVFKYSEALNEMLSLHDGSISNIDLIKLQYSYWKSFASAMISAQKEFIGLVNPHFRVHPLSYNPAAAVA